MLFFLLTEEADGISSVHQRRYSRQEYLPTPHIVVFLHLRPSALLFHPPPPVQLPPPHVPPLFHFLSSTQAHLILPQPTVLALHPPLFQIPVRLHSSNPSAHRSAPRLPVTADRHPLRVALLPGATCTHPGPINQVLTLFILAMRLQI